MLPSLSRLAGHADLARRGLELRLAGTETARAAARKHLVERMGKLRGLPQKLGQMLSFSHSDDNTHNDFAPLLESAEPLPWELIALELDAAWGCAWQDVLSEIDEVGHAASLGQVHRALLRDGREVAIKVQYPGIRESVHTDLSLLGWLSTPLGNLKRGFDLAGYRGAILADLERELDYAQEAATQREFAQHHTHDDAVIVPAVVDELCRPNILVTTWESGETWQSVEQSWSEDNRRLLGNRLVKWSLESLFVRGAIHADLHPGNLRFRQTAQGPQIVVYDFGCVFRPSDTERHALLRLIQSTITRAENPWPLFLTLGFDAKYLEPLASKLPPLCQVLFEPFLAPVVHDARQWRLGERVADILGADRWNFRIAGSPGLVFLLRAFHGLKYYLEGLRTPVIWNRVFREIWQQESDAAQSLRLVAAPRRDADFAQLSRQLKIRVTEAGQTKVELTCPATSIDDLSALIDEDLLARIKAQGNDLAQLTADVRRRGYAPGPIFGHREATKEVRVWLE